MRALVSIAAAFALVMAGLTTAAAPAEAVTTQRYAGADRYATSVAISRATNAGTTLFLANGEKFPDALAAGPVAAAERAHLLLTAPGRLPAIVAERIGELRPTEIVVVGSEASVSAAVATQAAGISGARVSRIGGVDRVDTSLRLLDRLASRGAVSTVWVASGFDFPDALVAASVAGRARAAVVLDHHAADPASAQAWADRVRPAVSGRHVRIAGGEPSVSAADAQGLRDAGAASVTRFAGQDRYTTARIINDAFAATPAEPTMLLTTGSNFPDALSGAVHASLRGVPMYLTTGTCNTAIADMLRGEAAQRGISRVIGLGTATTISNASLSLGPCPRTLADEVGDAYGRFAARSYSGSGDRVIDLGAGIPFAQIRASMPSTGMNQIGALDAGQQLVDLPLSFTGAYAGTSLLAVDSRDTPARFLEVTSDGSWTLQVSDLTSAPVLTGTASGSTDAVYLYGGVARTVEASGSGASFFGVREVAGAYATQAWPFSACCEPFTTTGQLRAGPSVLGVMAVDPWTLRFR